MRGRTRAVDDVSFELDAGTLVGLLGPSGCGKTTLMRSLVGTQVVSSGTVTLLGEPAGSPGCATGWDMSPRCRRSTGTSRCGRTCRTSPPSSVRPLTPSTACWPMSTSASMPVRSWDGCRVASGRGCRWPLHYWVRPAFSCSTSRRSASTRCCAGACGRSSAGWRTPERPCSSPATSWTRPSAVSGCCSCAMGGSWPTPPPRGCCRARPREDFESAFVALIEGDVPGGAAHPDAGEERP